MPALQFGQDRHHMIGAVGAHPQVAARQRHLQRPVRHALLLVVVVTHVERQLAGDRDVDHRAGDRVRIDLRKGTANILISDEELTKRRKALEAAGGFKYPASQTPWQEIQRAHVGQMGTGMVLENAVKYQNIDQTKGIPRDNH